MKVDPIAILVLAAGESARMGTPKQLLPWKKTTLLGHAINELEGLNLPIHVVLGAHYHNICPIISKSINIIYNSEWSGGMGTSLKEGFLFLENQKELKAVLVTLADQPLLHTGYYKNMISAYKKHGKSVASLYPDGSLGVPALFDRNRFVNFKISQGSQGAGKYISQHQQHFTTQEGAHLLRDIDTLMDYEELFNLHGA